MIGDDTSQTVKLRTTFEGVWKTFFLLPTWFVQLLFVIVLYLMFFIFIHVHIKTFFFLFVFNIQTIVVILVYDFK